MVVRLIDCQSFLVRHTQTQARADLHRATRKAGTSTRESFVIIVDQRTHAGDTNTHTFVHISFHSNVSYDHLHFLPLVSSLWQGNLLSFLPKLTSPETVFFPALLCAVTLPYSLHSSDKLNEITIRERRDIHSFTALGHLHFSIWAWGGEPRSKANLLDSQSRDNWL